MWGPANNSTMIYHVLWVLSIHARDVCSSSALGLILFDSLSSQESKSRKIFFKKSINIVSKTFLSNKGGNSFRSTVHCGTQPFETKKRVQNGAEPFKSPVFAFCCSPFTISGLPFASSGGWHVRDRPRPGRAASVGRPGGRGAAAPGDSEEFAAPDRSST